MSLRLLSRGTPILAALLVAASVSAEQPAKSIVKAKPASPAQVVGKQNFGTVDLTYVRLIGTEFYPYQGHALQDYQTTGNYRWSTTAGFSLEAGAHVPTGAILDYMEMDVCDNNATSDITLTLFSCDLNGGGCSAVTSLISTPLSGCGIVSISGINLPVDNSTATLGLEANEPVGDGTLLIGAAAVGYRLQVSPAPITPTFADVATDNIYYQFIEALASAGVTGGCDLVPNYCPDRPITRAEMAVFLAKALGLHFAN